MPACVREHQVLHGELDVDHAAAVVLYVEKLAFVWVRAPQLLAHLDDLLRERRGLTRPREDLVPDTLECRAHGGVACAVARAGKRLVFPHPRLAALVLLERRHA